MERGRLRAPFVVTLAVAGTACGTSDAGSRGDATTAADADAGDTTTRDADAFVDTGPKPNPASCPSDDPGFGARNKPCTAPAEDRCSYPDLCPSHPASSDRNVYACKDDGSGKRTWTMVSEGYTAECPKAPPADGDPCPCALHYGGEVCKFGDCETVFIIGTCASLDVIDKTWTMVPVGCNPPEPDASTDGEAGEVGDTLEAGDAG